MNHSHTLAVREEFCIHTLSTRTCGDTLDTHILHVCAEHHWGGRKSGDTVNLGVASEFLCGQICFILGICIPFSLKA